MAGAQTLCVPAVFLEVRGRLTAVESADIMSKGERGRRDGLRSFRQGEREYMGKRWIAAVLLGLALAGAAAAPPLAGAREGTAESTALKVEAFSAETEEPGQSESIPAGEAAIEEAEEGYLLVEEIVEPTGSLTEMRAAAVEGVPAEGLDAARYAVYQGLLTLEEDGSFDGEEPVSRGEAVQALYRLSGILVRLDECRYADVPEEYQDAVAWAVSCGVSSGVSGDCFAPDSPVTRSQLAVMLQRFAAWRGEDTQSGLTALEGEDVPAYAREALGWVLDRGLYEGMTDHGLYPDLPVSRLQLAAVLARLQRDRDPLAAELVLPGIGPASLSRQNHEAISEAIASAARRYGAVGVQAAVIENSAVTDTYCFGWAVKGTTPMTEQHKMRTASLSKVAVGLSAALLREEGVIDYDADIGDYWGKNAWNPRCPDTPVTIRSILTHTSTLVNSEKVAWDYGGVKAQLGTMAGYSSGTPGNLTNWSYNNHAFGVLGQTLELASGRFLDDVLKERLLTPLGADCAFSAGEVEHPELVTPLYRTGSLSRSAENLRRVRRWSTPGATGRQFAGGFTSSALDWAKLTALLAGDGCFEGVRLMDAASVELMESHGNQALPGGFYQALPLRLRFGAYGRERLYYHTGSAYGVYNLLSYDPDTGDGVVVLTMGADGRTDKHGIYAVCGEISKAVYDAIQ